VHKRRNIALAAGATAFAAALIAAMATASTASQRPGISNGPQVPVIHTKPGVVHMSGALAAVPTTSDCVKDFGIRCYQPGQIQAAYNTTPLYKKGITGKGQTIVIVDSFGSPTIAKDLATFDKSFGLPAPPSLKIIAPAGKIPTWNPNNADMTGWAGETTLDVEYAHTIAPGANIVLLETPVSETEGVTGFPQIVQAEDYAIAAHLGGVISQSFGATEQTFNGIAQINAAGLRTPYVRAAEEKNGPTVLAASGDDGATDAQSNGTDLFTFPVTSWPASDPLVTSVGGTQVIPLAHGAWESVAWNDTANPNVGDNQSPVASGGGLSTFFSRPSFQNGVASKVGSVRGVPDVSMSAACDGAVLTYQSFPATGQPAGFYLVCGTSEATPEFAGIVAMADQVAGHPLGQINAKLYGLASRNEPGIIDVKRGNNTVTFVQGGQSVTVQGFNAGTGYDLVTGVGTVNAWFLAYELAGHSVP
jgi:subtilase family serine protease